MRAIAEKIRLPSPGEKMSKQSGEWNQDLSDEKAISLVKSGHREAYRVIVERYKKRAYYLALSWVKNHQDALDLSQEAFIHAFRKLKKYDELRQFFPWFYQLLRNLCIDFLRRQKRVNCSLVEFVSLKEDPPAQRAELSRALWAAIDKLSGEQREVIILRYFQQYSYQEIAELTNMPIGTVMSTLYYAKQKLRLWLKEAWGNYSPSKGES